MILRFLVLSISTMLFSCAALNEAYEIPYDATMVSAIQQVSPGEKECLVHFNQCPNTGSDAYLSECESLAETINSTCRKNRLEFGNKLTIYGNEW